MVKFVGYFEENALPFKKGDTVVIPAGVEIQTLHPSKPHKIINKRKRKVKVNHLMNGQSISPDFFKRNDFPGYDAEFDHYDLLRLDARTEPDAEKSIAKWKALREYKIHTRNPKIVWPGTGGYWCEVDINDLLEANPCP